MKAFIKRMIATVGILSLSVAPSLALVPAVHAQDINQGICQGVTLDTTATAETCAEEDTENSFTNVITRVINIFSIVVGAVSVVMIIIGGFRYIISGGDSNGVSGAKNTILYAVVGLVIVLFAQIIVRFVLTNATK